MDRNAKKAIAKNRVRILGLDYFDLTAPLLASELLTTKKHKEIKTEATTSKARVDLLLEWLDETAPSDAFPAFLQGVRNCEEVLLAKKIKKEAANGGVDPKKPKISKPTVPFPAVINPNILNQVRLSTTKTPDKPKVVKSKPKIKKEPTIGGVGPSTTSTLPTTTVPFNGLPPSDPLNPIFPILPSSPNRKRKSGADKLKTPGNLNGKSSDSGGLKIVTGRPIAKATPKGNKSAAKSATPKTGAVPPTGTATPRTTRKSSNDKGEDASGKVKVKLPKIGGVKKKVAPAAAGTSASPANAKSPSKPAGKAKTMSFKDVEVKQLDCRQKFKFKNSEAVAKIVHFKDKTDISYLGCPFEENNTICEKKVELKSKEFVCESRHRSPNCKQIPKLIVTCNDGTADLQLTLLKSNVEIFCGKSAADLGTLSVNEIKDALDKTIGKKFAMEVHCEKMKKAAKKAGVPKWNNVAILSGNDDGSPAKKKRKN